MRSGYVSDSLALAWARRSCGCVLGQLPATHNSALLCQTFNFLYNQITIGKLLIGELWVYFTPGLSVYKCIKENLSSLNSGDLLEVIFDISIFYLLKQEILHSSSKSCDL